MGVDTSSTTLRVVRLTDALQLSNFLLYSTVRSLVVKRDGAVAWIDVNYAGHHGPRTTEVNRAGGATVQVLDKSPPSIKAKSLRLRGSRLSWKRNNGTTGHATLP